MYTVYKVLHRPTQGMRHEGELVSPSSHALQPTFLVYNPPGEWTVPTLSGSGLFVFLTQEDAESFCYALEHLECWEAETDEEPLPVRVVLHDTFHHSLDCLRSYWEYRDMWREEQMHIESEVGLPPWSLQRCVKGISTYPRLRLIKQIS